MPIQAIVTIGEKQWACWVASTPEDLQAGLSGVPDIPPETGMIFILPEEQIITVTSENMLFPLSVIFIGGDLQVTEVAYLLAPGDSGTTSLPCRYFLEVNAGEADDIQPGDTASIEVVAVPSAPASGWMAPVATIAGALMIGVLLANMGKTLADAMFAKPEDKPVLYGPRGELLPQTREKLYQRGNDGYPAGADKVMRDSWGLIPHPDQPFWSGKGFIKPAKIYGWSFSPDYNHWRAYVQFPDGTTTWTSPKRQTASGIRGGSVPDYYKAGGETLKRWAVYGDEAAASAEAGWLRSAEKASVAVQRVPGGWAVYKATKQAAVQKRARKDVEIGTWAERDRVGIWLTDKDTGKTIAEWWDDDAREMFEQGWFKPGDIRRQSITGRVFEESVLDYAESVGLIASTARPAAVTPVAPRRPRRKDGLEFLPDSPEFLAYTIDDIGYRDKIDTAFLQAIARARGGA
jgi:uncharacterized membrane protein (UPF0127 family)